MAQLHIAFVGSARALYPQPIQRIYAARMHGGAQAQHRLHGVHALVASFC